MAGKTGKMRRRRPTREKTQQCQARRRFAFGSTSVRHSLRLGTHLRAKPETQSSYTPPQDAVVTKKPVTHPEPVRPTRRSWW